MIWMILLALSNGLYLKNGAVLSEASFTISGNQVLVHQGEQVSSLPVSAVDWDKTRRPTSQSAESPRIQAVPDHQATDTVPQTLISIDVRKVSLIDLLRFLADEVGFNLYIDGSVKDEMVTYRLKNMPWQQVLTIVLANSNLVGEFQGTVCSVVPL